MEAYANLGWLKPSEKKINKVEIYTAGTYLKRLKLGAWSCAHIVNDELVHKEGGYKQGETSFRAINMQAVKFAFLSFIKLNVDFDIIELYTTNNSVIGWLGRGDICKFRSYPIIMKIIRDNNIRFHISKPKLTNKFNILVSKIALDERERGVEFIYRNHPESLRQWKANRRE